MDINGTVNIKDRRLRDIPGHGRHQGISASSDRIHKDGLIYPYLDYRAFIREQSLILVEPAAR